MRPEGLLRRKRAKKPGSFFNNKDSHGINPGEVYQLGRVGVLQRLQVLDGSGLGGVARKAPCTRLNERRAGGARSLQPRLP
jgi:hypothetical protein